MIMKSVGVAFKTNVQDECIYCAAVSIHFRALTTVDFIQSRHIPLLRKDSVNININRKCGWLHDRNRIIV